MKRIGEEDMPEETERVRPFTVLALDGGGIRGLYTSTVLEEITAFFAAQRGDENLDIGQRFDLIAGTSTGGILACGLAAGVPIQTISTLYKEQGPKIFSNPMPVNGFLAKASWVKNAATKSANKVDPLREALHTVFADATLGSIYGERKIALCVPSIKMINQSCKVFKTPHAPQLVIDRDYRIVDVCMATSAAPIFLPIAEIEHPKKPGQKEAFADGGLWANNPVLIGLLEALEMCFRSESGSKSRRSIEILSIGTCGLPEGDAPDSKTDRGIMDWLAGIRIAGLAMNAQAAAAAYMSRLLAQRISELGRSVRYVRIENPVISAAQAQHLQLDLATPTALSLLSQLGSQKAQEVMSKACNQSDSEGQFIREIFTR